MWGPEVTELFRSHAVQLSCELTQCSFQWFWGLVCVCVWKVQSDARWSYLLPSTDIAKFNVECHKPHLIFPSFSQKVDSIQTERRQRLRIPALNSECPQALCQPVGPTGVMFTLGLVLTCVAAVFWPLFLDNSSVISRALEGSYEDHTRLLMFCG